MQFTNRQQAIITLIQENQPIGISAIKAQLPDPISTQTLNRDLADLVAQNALQKLGKGRATTYQISSHYQLFAPFSDQYFLQDPDQRGGATSFNFGIIPLLSDIAIFTPHEQQELAQYQAQYQHNRSQLSAVLRKKETERLTIELSWKSAQIEGNTYSLLDTERLFQEQQAAKDKTAEETQMLLNHKSTLQYLWKEQDVAKTLTVRLLEEIHSLLMEDLGINRNIRSRSVGITGTSYRPLDNEFQIREQLEAMCQLINDKDNVFEKALLALVLISYIQPFEDGNKRTGRMISTALLLAGDACPLSYRSVDSLDYKKSMLFFYEQNNIGAFKKIFLEQSQFGVNNYFL
ncbi:MAG: cell filamentation protein Fic [Flavobacteriaceae bacterium]|nr:MAG: cell filamentation protein Fic [Flavobacteriaceae bacterium]